MELFPYLSTFPDPIFTSTGHCAGLEGYDSEYSPGHSQKGDRVMPLSEWQRKFVKGNVVGKRLHDQFDISEEHPGFKFVQLPARVALSPA